MQLLKVGGCFIGKNILPVLLVKNAIALAYENLINFQFNSKLIFGCHTSEVKNRQSMTARGYCSYYLEHCSKTNHVAIKGVIKRAKYENVFGLIAYQNLDFLKSPSSCLFSTRQTKDFSYLIGANFSDPKTGRCALTNQRSPGYPLGTDLSNCAQRNVTCG